MQIIIKLLYLVIFVLNFDHTNAVSEIKCASLYIRIAILYWKGSGSSKTVTDLSPLAVTVSIFVRTRQAAQNSPVQMWNNDFTMRIMGEKELKYIFRIST